MLVRGDFRVCVVTVVSVRVFLVRSARNLECELLCRNESDEEEGRRNM